MRHGFFVRRLIFILGAKRFWLSSGLVPEWCLKNLTRDMGGQHHPLRYECWHDADHGAGADGSDGKRYAQMEKSSLQFLAGGTLAKDDHLQLNIQQDGTLLKLEQVIRLLLLGALFDATG